MRAAERILPILAQWLDAFPSTPSLIVAYSGGRDSHVLLHALTQRVNPAYLKAIHVNHGLMPKARDWALHCQAICNHYAVPLEIIELSVEVKSGESLENIARKARYQAFSTRLTAQDILLTAHTEEDQAESFLLQLSRGSGIKGLAGIALEKKLGKGLLARPLLTVSKADIAIYAEENQLQWVEDNSNTDLRFRRNYVRAKVMPALRVISPSIAACIARSAEHCASAQALLAQYIEQDLQQCLGAKSHQLTLSAYLALSPQKQPHVFRHWLQYNQIPLPSTKKLADILRQIQHAKAGAKICIRWGTTELRYHKNHLYLRPISLSTSSFTSIFWDLRLPLTLANGSIWQAKPILGAGIALARKTNSTVLQLNYRQGGERCKPAGSRYTRPLKKILQEREIPAWERARLPLFYHGTELVCVAHLLVCDGWQVNSPHEQGWVIQEILD